MEESSEIGIVAVLKTVLCVSSVGCGFESHLFLQYSGIAQTVERDTLNVVVSGSSPDSAANFQGIKCTEYFY